MQVGFNIPPIYTTSTYNNKKQEKNQSDILNHTSFIMSNSYTLPFLGGLNKISVVENSFNDVFEGVSFPILRYGSNDYLFETGFKKFVKANIVILTEYIEEVVDMGNFPDDKKAQMKNLLMLKSRIKAANVLKAKKKDIVNSLGISETSYTPLNSCAIQLVAEHNKIIKNRKSLLKEIFPNVDFDTVSDKPEEGVVNEIVTNKQLMQKISSHKLKFDVTIKELLEKALESKTFDVDKDSIKQKKLLKLMFFSENGKFLSDSQIAEILNIPKDNFVEFEKAAFDKLYLKSATTKYIKIMLLQRGLSITDLNIKINNRYKRGSKLASMINNNTLPDDVINEIARVLGIEKNEKNIRILADKCLESPEILEYAIRASDEKEKRKAKSILGTKLQEEMKVKGFSRNKMYGYKDEKIFNMIIGKIPMEKNVIPRVATKLKISDKLIESWSLADQYPLEVLKQALNEIQPAKRTAPIATDWINNPAESSVTNGIKT